MPELETMKCEVCRVGAPTVTDAEAAAFLTEVPDWQIVERESIKRLERSLKFRNFEEALVFTNRVGAIAEEEGHHPTLITEWGKVTVVWYTHKIRGLHQNDFIMAAKTDRLYEAGQAKQAGS